MYITEVIEKAKALHPSEYSVKEYIGWCDELSSDLALNYIKEYKKREYSGVSEILLPEGVSIYNISKIIIDGREIKKSTLNDFGYEYEYQVEGRSLKKRSGGAFDATVIYIQPHVPIRYIDEDAEITVSDGGFKCDDIGIYVGDTLKIGDKVVHITDYDEDSGWRYEGDALEAGTHHIYREIQDKTIAEAPYDTMYIDFVNMKVAKYQGDSNAYRNFTQYFNNKAEDFHRYINRSRPSEERKFINWW